MRLFRKRAKPQIMHDALVREAAAQIYPGNARSAALPMGLTSSDLVNGIWMLRDKLQDSRDARMKAKLS